jgi:hypothetical protein
VRKMRRDSAGRIDHFCQDRVVTSSLQCYRLQGQRYPRKGRTKDRESIVLAAFAAGAAHDGDNALLSGRCCATRAPPPNSTNTMQMATTTALPQAEFPRHASEERGGGEAAVPPPVVLAAAAAAAAAKADAARGKLQRGGTTSFDPPATSSSDDDVDGRTSPAVSSPSSHVRLGCTHKPTITDFLPAGSAGSRRPVGGTEP